MKPLSWVFANSINERCEVSEMDGLVCKKCGHPVIIDWFEKNLECQGCDDI